jgi:sensor c-di-GMP phosphodiesterase-like protein
MALIIFLTFRLAVIDERKLLGELADRIFSRVELVDLAILGAIEKAEKIPKDMACDQAVRHELSRLISEARYIKNVAYVVSEAMLCTPIGMVPSALLSMPSERPEINGYKVWYKGLIDLPGSDVPVVTVAKGHIAVAIHKNIFTDVVLPAGISVRLHDRVANKDFSTKGEQYPISAGLFAQLLSGNIDADEQGHIFSSRTNDSLPHVVILSAPLTDIQRHWLESIWLWLPLSLIMGGFCGWAFRNAVLARFTPEQRLRRSIENGEMKAFYQPIIDLKTRRCVGAEALVRWIRPDGTMVRPDIFIPLAEESGLVVPLTDAVFEEIINDLAALLMNRDMYISINLSARDVAATRFLNLLTQRLKETSIPPQRIAIEATERGFLDAKAAKTSMAEYRKAGHHILIDDFGTGYSSLSYLQDLEVDVLKIDKSFVDTINADAVTSGVIPHIIAMAAQLNLKIVAEGVENEGQAKYLTERGVQCGQGWLFAKAMSAAEFIAWLETADKTRL